jgi:hypothetical protein
MLMFFMILTLGLIWYVYALDNETLFWVLFFEKIKKNGQGFLRIT